MNTKNIKMQPDNEELAAVAKNIDYLMCKKGIDGAAMSKVTGLGIATVNCLRRGVGNPTLTTLVSIAKFFNVSLSELTEVDLEKQSGRPSSVKTMPLVKLNEINNFLSNPVGQYETYTTEIDTLKNKSFFAVLINNDSLYPYFSAGTVCIISRDDDPCDGDIVLLKIHNYTPCFRRIFIENEYFSFSSLTLENDSSPSTYNNSIIVGVLLKSIKNFA